MNPEELQAIQNMLLQDAQKRYGYKGQLPAREEGQSDEDYLDYLEGTWMTEMERNKKVTEYKATNSPAEQAADNVGNYFNLLKSDQPRSWDKSLHQDFMKSFFSSEGRARLKESALPYITGQYKNGGIAKQYGNGGPGNPNQTMQQDYVLGPDGKTLGFYDQFGNFIPSNASSANANPYVAGMNQPMLQSTFSPNQTQNNMAGVMLGMGQMPQQNPKVNTQTTQLTGTPQMPNNIIDKFGMQPNFPQVGNPQGDGLSVVQGIQDQLEGATSDPTVVGDAGAGGQNALNPNLVKGGIGMGAALVSALGTKMGRGYDYRVGMERPSLAKSMSDLQFTQMGANLGPLGAGVGLIADTAKNLSAFQKHRSQFNKAETKADFYDARNDMMAEQMPDYTGLAKYGMKVQGGYGAKMGMGGSSYMQMGGQVPAELERDEIVYVPTADGGYQEYMETSADAPKHEDGGVKTTLPEGAVVFPGQFKKEAMAAFTYGGKTGDWSKFNGVKDTMLKRANKAFMDGKPYSSGGAMGYGGKYRDGGQNSPRVPKMPSMYGPKAPFMQSMQPLERGMAINQASNQLTTSTGIPYRYDDEGFPVITLDDEELDMPGDDIAAKNNKGTRVATGSGRLPIGSVKHTGNRGVVSGQQEMLNDLIKQARLAGSTDVPDYLVVDDVMGARTRAAMDYFQKQGNYETPELLSAENVAKYQQNWKNMSEAQKRAALLAGAKAIGKTPTAPTATETNRPKDAQTDQPVSGTKNPLVKAPGVPWYLDPTKGGMPKKEDLTDTKPMGSANFMPVPGLIGYEKTLPSPSVNLTDEGGTVPVPGLFPFEKQFKTSNMEATMIPKKEKEPTPYSTSQFAKADQIEKAPWPFTDTKEAKPKTKDKKMEGSSLLNYVPNQGVNPYIQSNELYQKSQKQEMIKKAEALGGMMGKNFKNTVVNPMANEKITQLEQQKAPAVDVKNRLDNFQSKMDAYVEMVRIGRKNEGNLAQIYADERYRKYYDDFVKAVNDAPGKDMDEKLIAVGNKVINTNKKIGPLFMSVNKDLNKVQTELNKLTL
jgi:hypothetical protein